MLKREGDYSSLKLIDFGFVLSVERGGNFEQSCGTAGFIAPELYSETSKYNEKCEVFSIGVIFYKLLTGEHPFEAETFREICRLNIEC